MRNVIKLISNYYIMNLWTLETLKFSFVIPTDEKKVYFQLVTQVRVNI